MDDKQSEVGGERRNGKKSERGIKTRLPIWRMWFWFIRMGTKKKAIMQNRNSRWNTSCNWKSFVEILWLMYACRNDTPGRFTAKIRSHINYQRMEIDLIHRRCRNFSSSHSTYYGDHDDDFDHFWVFFCDKIERHWQPSDIDVVHSLCFAQPHSIQKHTIPHNNETCKSQ